MKEGQESKVQGRVRVQYTVQTCELCAVSGVRLPLSLRIYGFMVERLKENLKRGRHDNEGLHRNGGTKSKTKRKPVGMNIPVDPPRRFAT